MASWLEDSVSGCWCSRWRSSPAERAREATALETSVAGRKAPAPRERAARAKAERAEPVARRPVATPETPAAAPARRTPVPLVRAPAVRPSERPKHAWPTRRQPAGETTCAPGSPRNPTLTPAPRAVPISCSLRAPRARSRPYSSVRPSTRLGRARTSLRIAFHPVSLPERDSSVSRAGSPHSVSPSSATSRVAVAEPAHDSSGKTKTASQPTQYAPRGSCARAASVGGEARPSNPSASRARATPTATKATGAATSKASANSTPVKTSRAPTSTNARARSTARQPTTSADHARAPANPVSTTPPAGQRAGAAFSAPTRGFPFPELALRRPRSTSEETARAVRRSASKERPVPVSSQPRAPRSAVSAPESSANPAATRIRATPYSNARTERA